MGLHYRNRKGSDSMGLNYLFGFNLYDFKKQPTLDLIFGKRVITLFWKRK